MHSREMCSRAAITASALTLLLVGAPVAELPAQTFAGAVVQPAHRRPISGVLVTLLRVVGAGERADTTQADSTRTSAAGLFQLVAPGSGRYRVRIGAAGSGYVFGPVDSVATDTTIARTYLATALRVLRDGAVATDSASASDVIVGVVPPCSPAPTADQRTWCMVVGFDADRAGKPRMKTLRVLQADDSAHVHAVPRFVATMHFPPPKLPFEGIGAGDQHIELPLTFVQNP